MTERIPIRQSGKHAGEYVAALEMPTLSLKADEGLTTRLGLPTDWDGRGFSRRETDGRSGQEPGSGVGFSQPQSL